MILAECVKLHTIGTERAFREITVFFRDGEDEHETVGIERMHLLDKDRGGRPRDCNGPVSHPEG